MIPYSGYSADWIWHNPQPAGSALYAITASETGLVAGAGDGGVIIEVDTGLHPVGVPATSRLNDIDLSGDLGVAAGEYSTVLVRNGTAWERHFLPVTVWFYGAAMLQDGRAFVCGESGKIFMYSGGTWQEMTTNTTSTFKDVEMIDSTHGIAAGLFGTVRVFNGTSWSYVSSQTTRFLRKISAFSPSRAWIVGDLGTILIWNGSSFQMETSPAATNLLGVAAVSSDEAYAVGEAGTILHRTAGIWNAVTFPELPVIDFYSIFAGSPSDLWLTGAGGFIARFDGAVWHRMDMNPIENTDLYAAEWSPELDSLLLAGSGGAIYEFNGTDFTAETSGTGSELYALHRDSTGIYYATGSRGTILRKTGTAWQTLDPGTDDIIFDIDALSPTCFWTAGGLSADGCVSYSVLHYHNGAWTNYSESGT
jgi:hypothetical protein